MTRNQGGSGDDLQGQGGSAGDHLLYNELVDLRQRGLANPEGREGEPLELPELTRIANVVYPDDPEPERLKKTLLKAVDRLGRGEYSAAICDWWGLAETYGWTYPRRRRKAIERMDVPESSFDRNYRKPMTKDLAVKLTALHSESVPVADDSPTEYADPPRDRRGRAIKQVIPAVAALLVLGGAVALLLLKEPDSSHRQRQPVPPSDAIINARTGHLNSDLPDRLTPVDARIMAGNILRACNISISGSCDLSDEQLPVSARAGDTIEFVLFLFNPSQKPLPYVSVSVDWVRPKGHPRRIRATPIIGWPSHDGTPAGIGPEGAVNLVRFLLPSEHVDLVYTVGSATLLDNAGGFIARLPDTINDFHSSVSLVELGSPIKCSDCDPASYARFIDFKAQMVSLP